MQGFWLFVIIKSIFYMSLGLGGLKITLLGITYMGKEVVWTSVISQYRETSKKLLLESLLYHPL